MRIQKTGPVVPFRGNAEKIIKKQEQYVSALDGLRQAPTMFSKEVWQGVALIYWKQLNDLIEKLGTGMLKGGK